MCRSSFPVRHIASFQLSCSLPHSRSRPHRATRLPMSEGVHGTIDLSKADQRNARSMAAFCFRLTFDSLVRMVLVAAFGGGGRPATVQPSQTNWRTMLLGN